MLRRNTMDMSFFILCQAALAAIIGGCYCAALFRPLSSHGTLSSLLTLAACLFLSSAVGILFQRSKAPNLFSAVVNAGWGVALYHALSLVSFRANVAGLAAIAAFDIPLAVHLFGLPDLHPRHRPRLLLKILGEAHRTAALCMVALIAGVAAQGWLAPENTAASAQEIAVQPEQIELLRSDSWAALDDAGRLRVLQAVADLERQKLGLPDRLTVALDQLPGIVGGYYQDDTHDIHVDVDYLRSTTQWNMVAVICHEAYHGYQHRLVQLYRDSDASLAGLACFAKAKKYEYELTHYVDCNEDEAVYSRQALEVDANAYARSAAQEYRQRIAGA